MACKTEMWKCKTCKKTFKRPVGGMITAIRRAKKMLRKVKMIKSPCCGKDSIFIGVQKNGKQDT